MKKDCYIGSIVHQIYILIFKVHIFACLLYPFLHIYYKYIVFRFSIPPLIKTTRLLVEKFPTHPIIKTRPIYLELKSKDNSNHLSDLLDVFNLENLVREPTCFLFDKTSLIDIILTKKPRSGHKAQGFVTDISIRQPSFETGTVG